MKKAAPRGGYSSVGTRSVKRKNLYGLVLNFLRPLSLNVPHGYLLYLILLFYVKLYGLRKLERQIINKLLIYN
jgi:hypothetical protein